MIPPTSIDGTDITGATIDGTDVQEITVDGDVVFSAGPQINNFPVAYSNLVAWYPFDSATYGGSNADDVTAIIGGSGDDTAYDGVVSGATYQSSGGVTDINAGANSGAFDFDGNDYIDLNTTMNQLVADDFTICCWAKPDNTTQNGHMLTLSQNFVELSLNGGSGGTGFAFAIFDIASNFNVAEVGSQPQVNQFHHVCGTYDNNSQEIKLFVNGVRKQTTSSLRSEVINLNWFLGYQESINNRFFEGVIEDARFYDKTLSPSEISQIYQNTQP